MAAKQIRDLLLEIVELGKKAETLTESTESFSAFYEKCLTNKSIPKLLRDIEGVSERTIHVRKSIQRAKAKSANPTTTTKAKAKSTDAPLLHRIFCYMTNKVSPQEPKSKPKQKGGKKRIPAALRKQVWNQYVGAPIGQTSCPVCLTNVIDKLGFEAGHIVPESLGGPTTIENLRPICSDCNRSMGAMDMREYAQRYYNRALL